ncbi:EpsG family protein [Clostridium cochlearium]|uniref:EpsG family protein n=1 Tax=Clostridium cochlearium TaxID=1494 RepID=UPI0022E28DA9|nr:EpsG family protein [Clostridium cochlearium]
MGIYIFNIISIFFLAFLFFIFIPIKNRKECFLFFTFVQLFFISALRYEVGLDFINYIGTFQLVKMRSSISELLGLGKITTVEYGYLFLNRAIGLLTNQSQWIFIVTSFIIIYLVFRTVKDYSSIAWMSIYLFSVEAYISSFNIMRQYIAVSIVFFSYKYVKKRNFNKFLLSILIASMFHTSALLVLPVYFILNKNLNIKIIVYSIFIGFIVSIFFDSIISIIQKVFYGKYIESSFGMFSGNINNVIIAFVYFSMAMIFKKNLLKRNNDNNILINWSFINLALSIMSMNMWIITRFMSYSSIFNILLIPEIIISIKDKLIRRSMIIVIIIFTLLLYFNTITNPANKLIPYQILKSF